MAKPKRFYWIKLKENFFNDDSMIWLESQKDGFKYQNLYLKLLLKTMNTNGQLAFNIGGKLLPMSADDISILTRLDVDTVIVGISLLKQIGLITETEGTDVLPDVNEMIGSESESAQRMRKLREKTKLKELGENTSVTFASQCDIENRV